MPCFTSWLHLQRKSWQSGLRKQRKRRQLEDLFEKCKASVSSSHLLPQQHTSVPSQQHAAPRRHSTASWHCTMPEAASASIRSLRS